MNVPSHVATIERSRSTSSPYNRYQAFLGGRVHPDVKKLNLRPSDAHSRHVSKDRGKEDLCLEDEFVKGKQSASSKCSDLDGQAAEDLEVIIQ